MSQNRSRGFTLIELLVVIAIIGILSAVVLASLNTARSKGSDATIQADLSTIRTQAEIYYGGTGNNSYGTANSASACSGANAAGSLWVDATIARAITSANSTNGTGSVTCNNTGSAYAISVQMVTSTSNYWCVDSSGAASLSTTALGTATACP